MLTKKQFKQLNEISGQSKLFESYNYLSDKILNYKKLIKSNSLIVSIEADDYRYKSSLGLYMDEDAIEILEVMVDYTLKKRDKIEQQLINILEEKSK